jgi:hypothetical protein
MPKKTTGRKTRLGASARKKLNGEYINCSNPACYSGGIKLGQPMRDMVRARETEKEGSKLCQGSKGFPKGRRIYRKCTNFFKYKITINYRTPETKIGD